MSVGSSFDAAQWPNRLNLGCGWDRRPGYLNIDFVEGHGPDLVADVRNLSMLPDAAYGEVVAQDVLEHLPRADGPTALREWSRLLRPGGRLFLRVPNILGLAHLMTMKRTIADQEELVMCLYGTQAYDGDFHQNGYTELLLRHQLREAGFGTVEVTPLHEWLFDVVATKGGATGNLSYDRCAYMTLDQPSAVAARLAEPTMPPLAETSTVMHYIREVARRARGEAPTLDETDLESENEGEAPPQSYAQLAADHADIGTIVPDTTRFRMLKRAMVRLSRHFTHHQVVFNHAVLAALAERPPPSPPQPDPGLAVAVAALDVQVEELQAKLRTLLADRRALAASPGGSGATPTRSRDDFYLAFEEAFRGSREQILDLFEEYVDDLVSASGLTGGRVLDLGPGRCELLELLTRRGVDAYGVDANEAMVEAGRQRGFDVVLADGLEHLRSLPDEALAAVTGMHIIEHLGVEDIFDLVEEAHRVLRPGGRIILETPNPTSWQVGANTFHLDPTHLKPVHPLFLEFLLQESGFAEVEVRMLHPADQARIGLPAGATDPAIRDLIERFNQVNAGPQDYAVLAYRPPAG